MSRNLAPAAESALDEDVVFLRDVDISAADAPLRNSKVSFAVGPTALLSLVGPADSGKSTILDLLSFQTLPSRGHLRVFGIDPARLAPSERPRMRRRVGFLFQDQRLLPDLDVFANVALAARVARRKPQDSTSEISELLVWVGLGGRGSDMISKLTDGEKRRLCLARALINRPELLIADEPTAGLGYKAERAVLRLIGEVNAAGTPVVVATRDRSLAMSLGGAVYDMPARDAS